jgi:hypothetical protein
MSVRNLDKLFKPRAVALIGATPRHSSLGAVLARNLRRGGFGGPLMLVHPHQRSIGGMPVYSGIASRPEIPDLAVIATPPEIVPGAIAGLGDQGTRKAPQQGTGGWEPIRRNGKNAFQEAGCDSVPGCFSSSASRAALVLPPLLFRLPHRRLGPALLLGTLWGPRSPVASGALLAIAMARAVPRRSCRRSGQWPRGRRSYQYPDNGAATNRRMATSNGKLAQIMRK